jgi:hypothetical protein
MSPGRKERGEFAAHNFDINQYLTLKPQEGNWRNLAKTGMPLVQTGRNWLRLAETG